MAERWTGVGINRRTILLSGLGVGAVSALSACGGGETSSSPNGSGASGTPKPGGTLRAAFSSVSTAEAMDPVVTYLMFSKFFDGLVYDQLLTADLDYNAKPMLAEDWSVNDAADVWKFKIRGDAKFHDGSPVTSRDVAATFRRVLDPATAARGQSQLAASLEASGISALDASTLELKLSKPNALLASTIGGNGNYFAVIPESSNESDPGKGVGSGPFKVKDFRAGTSFEVVRNDDFWGDEPFLDAVTAFAVNQQSTKLQSVTSGDAQLCDPISLSQARLVTGNAKTLEVPNAVHLDIAMDVTAAPFNNPKVVEAIKLATGREKIAATAFNGFGELTADIPVAPSHPYFPTALEVPSGDTQAAKQLLADAGYPDGIDITVHTADVTGGMVDLAVVFGETVKDAGIRVKIEQGPPNTYFEDVFMQVPMFVSYWSSRPTLDLLNQTYRSDASSNESGWNSPEFDGLLDQVAATTEASEQEKLMQEAMTILSAEAGTVIPAVLPYLWVQSSGLQGIEPGTSGTVNVRQAYLA